jgi:anaerobic ribonucleoside-triphosphate reductase
MKYKCHTCKNIVEEKPCPICGEVFLQEMCELDNCTCFHEVTAGIKYCEKCGQPVCPICNCHDVLVWSRVTGYLQDINGWNLGKRQELKDRYRINL